MGEVQGGNQAILTLIRSETYQAKILDPYYDCSEIAEDLLDVGGKDIKLIYITPKIGQEVSILELEYGKVIQKKYCYHYVVRDEIYIYEPRLSLDPILRKDYRAQIRQLNPKGITTQVEFRQFGAVIRKPGKL